MIDRKSVIFLLGGQDLEMHTIRDILEKEGFEEGINLFDKKLSWGAKLSAYEDVVELNPNKTIYAIELEEDIPLPKNYVRIDHHNDYNDREASILQVLKLLGLTPSREQELIAANDSHYIAGMRELCASKEEIKSIRKRDKKAQGVIEIDEEMAVKAINTAQSNNLNIFFTKTEHFTVITDVIFNDYSEYIIHNKTKMVFYGYDLKKLKDFLKEEDIDEDSYYYGGGDFGFLGIKNNLLELETIKDLIKSWQDHFKNEKVIHSYHTFMLPFVFDDAFETRDTKWKYKKFKILEPRDYNESVYFYKHVQDAIFNQSEIEHKEFISKYYEYAEQKGSYIIQCKYGDFELEVDGISLRVFNTNVGILSFNLCNTKYSKPKEILSINDFGRRIYPQFLGKEYTKETKDSILANCLTLKLGNEVISENFEHFNDVNNLTAIPKLPSFIDKLIGKMGNVRPIIDDRMFVISQYNNDNLTKELSNFKSDKTYSYVCNDWWYEYVFVDGNGKTCQSKLMTQKFVEKSTYDRWVEWGTLFGVSRYSFVALTGSCYGKNVLLPHMQTIYFQMFTLLLSYRASIIKFSDDIQNITSLTDNKIRKETPKLYSRYLKFINKIYFKEVTAQDQGIELYQKAMDILEIDKYMLDLDREMNELHTYVAMLDEREQIHNAEAREKRLESISNLGAIFLPPSLLTGIYGGNVTNYVKDDTTSMYIAAATITLSAFLGWVIIKYKDKDVKLLASIGMVLLLAGSLLLFPTQPIDNKDTNITKKEQHVKN